MAHLTHSTKSVSAQQIQRTWHEIDAKGKVLGRISTEISQLLIGKQKITYVPYLDGGDYVVVKNAKQVTVTGKKPRKKMYTFYSGYPGGLREVSYKELQKKNPTEIIRHAVSGKLPKNKHRKPMLTRLFIFPEEDHPYKENISSS